MGRVLLAILIVLCFDMVGPVYRAASAALTGGGPACQIYGIYQVQLVGWNCFTYHVYMDTIRSGDQAPLLIRPLINVFDISPPGVLVPYLALVALVGLILLKLRWQEILEALGLANYHLEEIRRLS